MIHKGGNLFCAFRDCSKGDFDIIGFETYQEMADFCDFNADYLPFETSLLGLEEAKAIFEGVI